MTDRQVVTDATAEIRAGMDVWVRVSGSDSAVRALRRAYLIHAARWLALRGHRMSASVLAAEALAGDTPRRVPCDVLDSSDDCAMWILLPGAPESRAAHRARALRYAASWLSTRGFPEATEALRAAAAMSQPARVASTPQRRVRSATLPYGSRTRRKS